MFFYLALIRTLKLTLQEIIEAKKFTRFEQGWFSRLTLP